MTRAFWVAVHRWVGLVLAGFLVLAGLTGSLIVWYPELDARVNPQLMRVTPPAGGGASGPVPLDPLVLRARVQAAYPDAWVHWVTLRPAAPDAAASFWVEGAADASGRHADLGFDEVFVDPYTGGVLGTRRWGDLSQGAVNLMPFVYRLHHSLALGTVGTWTFGIVAVLWTLDCFVGAWLTLPMRTRGDRARRGWWSRWRPAWAVRWRTSPYRLNVDLHRAGGLWPWAALFVLAWSSVALNLYGPVYRPVMGLGFDFQADPRSTLPRGDTENGDPAIGWTEALRLGRQHLGAQLAAHGVTLVQEDRLSFDPHRGVVRYEARTSRDVSERRGRTAVYLDARTGRLLATSFPTGGAAGNTVTAWLVNLHLAHVWGLPYRLVMTVLGVVVAMLSVTGVVIWWKKRQGRRARREVLGLNGGQPASPAAPT